MWSDQTPAKISSVPWRKVGFWDMASPTSTDALRLCADRSSMSTLERTDAVWPLVSGLGCVDELRRRRQDRRATHEPTIGAVSPKFCPCCSSLPEPDPHEAVPAPCECACRNGPRLNLCEFVGNQTSPAGLALASSCSFIRLSQMCLTSV